MNEPTTWTIAIAVLALLLCLRRRRTGDGGPTTESRKNQRILQEMESRKSPQQEMAERKLVEELRVRDQAFQQFNNLNEVP